MFRRRISLLFFCFSFVLTLSLVGTREARAQFNPACFGSGPGAFSAIATIYVGAPNVVFLIGNAVRLGTKPSKVWGITGIVTSTTAAFFQLLAMFGDTTPSCGDPTPAVAYNAVMIGIYAVTFALGVANTVAVDRKRANAPPPKRRAKHGKRRWGAQPERLSNKPAQRVMPQPRPSKSTQTPKAPKRPELPTRPKTAKRPVAAKQPKAVASPKVAKRPTPGPAKLSCPAVFKVYEGLLKEAARTKDNAKIMRSLVQLERDYFPCFFTRRRGRKLRKRRSRLRQGKATQPSGNAPTPDAKGSDRSTPPSAPTPGRSFSEHWGL